MNDNGLATIPKILPLGLHNFYQTARWSIGATYVRIKHKGFIKKELKDLDPAVSMHSGTPRFAECGLTLCWAGV